MAGFADVLLRGALLVFVSVVMGGVVWLRLVLGAEPGAKPDAAAASALRLVAAAAWLTAAAQLTVLLVALGALAAAHDAWPVGEFVSTTFASTGLARVAIGVVVALLAGRLARAPAGRAAWLALGAGAVALVAASAVLSHAVARVEGRAFYLLGDAAHQLAAAIWVGGLAHLTLWAALEYRRTAPHAAGVSPPPIVAGHAVTAPTVLRRFSTLALAAVAALTVAGVVLAWAYVGDAAALVGTAYGVMILSKVALFVVVLGLAWANFRAVRRASAAPGVRLFRRVEVELGLVVTVLFAAASLTSLPPAVDVTTDRATVAEVADRFRPAPPRLVSPPVAELIQQAEPLMAPVTRREPIERAWSEYNHHWAGFFVVTMGLLAVLERLGVRAARHWPLVFLGLAAFLFVRNDPRAWPLGPAGFWESLALPDVLQHRVFVLLVVAFAAFEWGVRTGRLAVRPWGYVFPLLCAVGGGLLLTHSHAMFNLKEEFLTEVTHAPLGIFGAFAGWARWVEVRLPEAGRGPGWISTACFLAVGLLLLFYREG
jgi:putative copper resistance protein D